MTAPTTIASMVAAQASSTSGGGLLDRVRPVADVAASARANLADALPDSLDEALPERSRPEVAAPDASRGTGYDRFWLDGVTPDRPMDVVPTVITNVVESVSGTRDERIGRSLSQVLLGASQLLQAGLMHLSRGTGVVAGTSSVLTKVLPLASIAGGAWQVWAGWNELPAGDRDVTDILQSRTARTGLLQVLAGGLMFIPGIGPLVAGAGVRLLAAANELDAFSFLDGEALPVEYQGEEAAGRVHVFDDTPTDPYDRDAPAG